MPSLTSLTSIPHSCPLCEQAESSEGVRLDICLNTGAAVPPKARMCCASEGQNVLCL